MNKKKHKINSVGALTPLVGHLKAHLIWLTDL